MAEDADVPAIPVTDPYNVPVVYADNFASGLWNGLVSITFTTNRINPTGDEVHNDNAIVARMKLDLHCATRLRDRLNVLVGMLTKPEGQAN